MNEKENVVIDDWSSGGGSPFDDFDFSMIADF